MDSGVKKDQIRKLRLMRSLLARPGGWCQGFYARDRHGTKVSVINSEAVSFCLHGAFLRVGCDVPTLCDICAIDVIREDPVVMASGRGQIGYFNDNERTTQKEVIDLLDRCINRLEGDKK